MDWPWLKKTLPKPQKTHGLRCSFTGSQKSAYVFLIGSIVVNHGPCRFAQRENKIVEFKIVACQYSQFPGFFPHGWLASEKKNSSWIVDFRFDRHFPALQPMENSLFPASTAQINKWNQARLRPSPRKSNTHAVFKHLLISRALLSSKNAGSKGVCPRMECPLNPMRSHDFRYQNDHDLVAIYLISCQIHLLCKTAMEPLRHKALFLQHWTIVTIADQRGVFLSVQRFQRMQSRFWMRCDWATSQQGNKGRGDLEFLTPATVAAKIKTPSLLPFEDFLETWRFWLEKWGLQLQAFASSWGTGITFGYVWKWGIPPIIAI